MSLKSKVKSVMRRFGRRPVYITVGQLTPDTLLEGKRIVVTGGGSGIGKEIARAAASHGAEVLITGRNEEKLNNAVAELNDCGKAVSFMQWDIWAHDNMAEVIKNAENLLGGGINCWVNNVGVYPGNYSYQNTTDKIWDSVFDTNLKSTCMVTNAIARHMIEQKTEGIILTISSETGFCAYTNPYGLSKAALNSYIKGMAYELAKYGIRCNGIAPGITVSEINPRAVDGDLSARTIIKRMMRPEEIAQTALFLLSDISKCVNGEIIICNGGNCLPVEYFR